MADFSAVRSSVAVQSAYSKTRTPQNAASDQTDTDKADFSKMVSDASAKAVEAVRQGDSTALAGLSGQVGIQQVVEATMAMESTVRVSVSVRDKLVEAYQEIMRMPI